VRIPGLKGGISIADAIALLARSFRTQNIESPEIDARALVGHALKITRASLLANSDRALDTREAQAIAALGSRRIAHEPVARILGRREFWSLPLQVTPAVLVPRPETETIVEAALDIVHRDFGRNENIRILDIGTGTGALLLALLSECDNASGVGTDISEEAIAVARSNAALLGFGEHSSFMSCNGAEVLDGPFDLIVSNPPYIQSGDVVSLAPEVRDFDPRLALDGGPDGLDGYRLVAREAKRLLAPNGHAIVELGVGQEQAVRGIFTEAGLAIASVRPDLAGIPRALAAKLTP
jgi:release factor glutamine methyltransferase